MFVLAQRFAPSWRIQLPVRSKSFSDNVVTILSLLLVSYALFGNIEQLSNRTLYYFTTENVTAKVRRETGKKKLWRPHNKQPRSDMEKSSSWVANSWPITEGNRKGTVSRLVTSKRFEKSPVSKRICSASQMAVEIRKKFPFKIQKKIGNGM